MILLALLAVAVLTVWMMCYGWKMMWRLFGGVALAVLLLGVAHGQGQVFAASTYRAADYGGWVIQSQQANTFRFSPVSSCQVPSVGGGLFSPFATNAPVWIQDATPANSEVLVPTSVLQSSAQCGVNLSVVNAHTTFALRSGTGGLQEALNALAPVSGSGTVPVEIVLDRNWYVQAGSVPGKTPAGIIAAAAGNTRAFLKDVTTVPETYYQWNGTAYVFAVSLTPRVATAPSGACTVAGAFVVSSDGHGTSCAAGVWTSRW